jgi:hypothetical protein
MHSVRVTPIPPDNATDIDVAGFPFGLNDPVYCEHSPLLSGRQEMQLVSDDYSLLAAHISFCLAGSRILCAARLRVRYLDFGHNFGVIKSGSAGVF